MGAEDGEWISAKEAALILKVAPDSAAQALRRNKTETRHTPVEHGGLRATHRHGAVMVFAETSRGRRAGEPPAGTISALDAAQRLGPRPCSAG